MPSVGSAEVRVKAAPAASAASEALTRPSASTESACRSGGYVLHWRDVTGFHQPRLAEAVVPMLVTDDQVIEQRQVEDVGRGAQPQRQSRIVRTRCGITARMVVDDHQAGRARCETRRHEDIRHRDRRAGARAARHHMPGEQAVLRRQTRHGEDLDGLIGDQRREDRRGGTRVLQHHSRDVDDASVAVTQRAVGADEFPHAVTACGCEW